MPGRLPDSKFLSVPNTELQPIGIDIESSRERRRQGTPPIAPLLGLQDFKYHPVLRIQDVYPGSLFLIQVHPGSRISDPGSRISNPGSWIPYPGTKNSNKREGQKNQLSHVFCSHKYPKIEIYFDFELTKNKIWANLQRFIELPT